MTLFDDLASRVFCSNRPTQFKTCSRFSMRWEKACLMVAAQVPCPHFVGSEAGCHGHVIHFYVLGRTNGLQVPSNHLAHLVRSGGGALAEHIWSQRSTKNWAETKPSRRSGVTVRGSEISFCIGTTGISSQLKHTRLTHTGHARNLDLLSWKSTEPSYISTINSHQVVD